VVYFVTDGATVNLPLATTAGQQLTLLDANVTGNGFFAKANSADTVRSEPDVSVSAPGATVGPFGTAMLISDGNHNWYVSYSN
jgi:hypothetical protein